MSESAPTSLSTILPGKKMEGEEAISFTLQLFQAQPPNSAPPLMRKLTRLKWTPKKFAESNFRNFEFNEEDGVPKKYGLTCYYWAKGSYAENCLILCGNIGNGKTHLAISAMKEVLAIRTGQSLFIPSGELFEQLLVSTYNHDNKVESIKSLVHLYDCLCIDGLERKHFTEASVENLYLLINRVYLENSKLIVTTNLAAEAFKELDERIYSRFHEMSIILPFKWEDYRMRKKIAHS